MSLESAIFNLSTIVVLACFIVIACATLHIVFGWGTNHPDNKPTEKGCKASTLKQYAEKVDDMLCKQDDVNKEKILAFPDVNSKEEKCIDHRAKLGGELYEDEIMKCYLKNN